MSKYYKKGKKGAGRFVQLPEWLLSSEAWRTMKPGPRALYIELKRLYNGGNNGAIYLSHRDAAKALAVGRDTVAQYFVGLIERGFIKVTKGHCLGPSGVGQAASYALTEEALNGAAATKEFMSWKKQIPVGKSDIPWQENPTPPVGKSYIRMSKCRKILPLFCKNKHSPCRKILPYIHLAISPRKYWHHLN